MHWNSQYIVSRALTMQIGRDGMIEASHSISRAIERLDSDIILILLAFSNGATPLEAYNKLTEDWKVEKGDFQSTIETLISKNILIAADEIGGANAILTGDGFASLYRHHNMLKDNLRVLQYRTAINQNCKNKVVADLGSGTGILSLFAAQAGAKKVYAIEESSIAQLAQDMFEVNNFKDRIHLVPGHSRDIHLKEPVDVLIHEIIGVDPFVENILPCIQDARQRFLKPKGRLIPHQLKVLCIGFESSEDRLYAPSIMLREALEFQSIYGLNFSPFLDALHRIEKRETRLPIINLDHRVFNPRFLSEPYKIVDIDFYQDLESNFKPASEITLKIIEEGQMSGVLVYFRAYLDEKTELNNSPFTGITNWGRDAQAFSRVIPVRPGDNVTIKIQLRFRNGSQSLYIDAVE